MQAASRSALRKLNHSSTCSTAPTSCALGKTTWTHKATFLRPSAELTLSTRPCASTASGLTRLTPVPSTRRSSGFDRPAGAVSSARAVAAPVVPERVLRSQVAGGFTAVLILVPLLLGALYLVYQPRDQSTPSFDSATEEPSLTNLIGDMAVETLPGHPGNLTPEQEQKLRQLWTMIFHVCNVGDEEQTSSPALLEEPAQDRLDPAGKEGKKKKKFGMFSRKDKKDIDSDSIKSAKSPSGTMSPITPITPKEGEAEDKYGQTKQFYETIAKQSPESIRATIWGMVKHDHPDALVLRFLRARKWDVEKALVMLISTMNWRATEMHVDDDIMKNGEGAAAEVEKGVDSKEKTLGHDFLAQIRMGKSYLHGTDKNGRPICVVRVRLHKQGEQCEESLERYTVYLIETARMVLSPPVDTATVLFDMTGFSMANMDYAPVKFMIKCFEANYPESLGAVLVHKAPWVFQGIWKIIRGWLDPVVASKVHFTNNSKELEEFIELSRVPKELEGNEDWSYSYAEPVPGENDKMKDTETRDKLIAAREGLFKEYENATLRWVQNASNEKGAAVKAERDAIAARLREDYWRLDPYVRARSIYDRQGIIQAGGKINFYPTASSAPRINGAPAAVETSADDVD